MIRWNGTQWSREPVELPSGYEGSFEIVGLAGSSPQNLYLLGKASPESGLGMMLFKRVEKAGEGRWEPVELGSALFSASATPAQDVSGVAPLRQPRPGADGLRPGRVDRRQPAGARRRQRRV